MKVIYETQRLVLRELVPADDFGMFELDSDAQVHQYLGGRPAQTIEESRNTIENIRKQYVDFGIGRWAVIEKASGNFVGWSGIKLCTEHRNGHDNYHDLGYRFVRSAWGNGYATESARPAIQHAFNILNIHELYANAMKDNLGSRHVLEKLGFGLVNYYMDRDLGKCAWYVLRH